MQMRPELASPQSESAVQPQRPMRQAAPVALAMQLERSSSVHCAQVLLGPMQRVRPSVRLAQCESIVHSTQAFIPLPPPVWVRHTGVAPMQSASRLQLVVQTPVAPDMSAVQLWPIGQPLRPSPIAQPASQRRVMPLQMRPEPEAPQSASVEQPQKTIVESICTRQTRPLGFIAQRVASPFWPGVQSLQVELDASHTGVSPMQAVVFIGVHWTHAPAVEHARVPSRPAHSLSCEHARHTLFSHTGVLPEHWLLLVH